MSILGVRCPFCQEMVSGPYEDNGMWRVECVDMKCGASGPVAPAKEEAIARYRQNTEIRRYGW